MTHVVIAVRGGAQTKQRCAGLLDVDCRVALVRTMLADMIDACRRARGVEQIWVVTPSVDLAVLAMEVGARSIREPAAKGLGEAFAVARSRIATEDPAALTLLLPGDLPLLDAADLDAVMAARGEGEGVLVGADADGGTGAILIPADLPFEFAYGVNSLARHLAAVRAAGLVPRTVDAPSLAFDLDRPADIAQVLGGASESRTRALLANLTFFREFAA